jgi:flavin-dependent dehydrogenase
MTPNKTEVLVIGGGPAGATFGTFMSMRGKQVTLLEKDHHPRFHIGESLLPMNLPIMERMGVLEKIRAIGVPKMGADFSISGDGEEYNTYHFARALGDSPDHAFEVRRSEFDQVLFEHCKSVGVDALQGVRVNSVRKTINGTHRVVAVDDSGQQHTWETDFLVDASGRDTFLASENGWKKRNPRHASAAVFAHFVDVERRPGRDAVCRPEYLKTRRDALDEFLQKTLNEVSEVQSRMANARQVVKAQATGNYSYLSDRMHGPGFVMIGDAYAFIDPVFSSGVYLAMSSAERAVNVAEAWFSGSRRRWARAARKYEADTRRGLGYFSWFIYRFTSPAMRYLMSNPRDMFKVVQGVISLLAGDVFDNRRVRSRLWLFRCIYGVAWLVQRRQKPSAHAAGAA